MQSRIPSPIQRLIGPSAVPTAQPHGRLRRLLLAGAAVAALAGASWYGWDYWTVGRFLVSTDDAYVRADNTTIAPKVSGYLREVLVGDNEHVKAGQVLARIDDRDFKVALDQARADVAAAEAAVASKQAQLEVQQADDRRRPRATVEVDTAAKTFAGQENKRYTDLAATGYGSVQNAQAAQAKNAGAEAAIQRDTANLASALKQVELLKAEIAQADRRRRARRRAAGQAELNLGYTTITAPIDGVVGNRTLRVGQFVQAGTQLMSLVPADRRLCDRELQGDAAHRRACRASRSTSPSTCSRARSCTAMSISLAPASGQEFALLPPDNATGNFTKVVQRIPVKIVLDGGAPIELRPGMSVVPHHLDQAAQRPQLQPKPSVAYPDCPEVMP